MSRLAVPGRAPARRPVQPGPFAQPSFPTFMALLVLLVLLGVLALAAGATAGQAAPAWTDPSPHQVRRVTVAPNVELEVLDWGGSGRDVVLLTGSGHTAHVYDEFALKLKDCCHVYGITRRGYGASSLPESGYDEPSLSNDVWMVIQALDLKAPVLIGHSMAGAELTGVGMLHSARLGGLVYLDAIGDSTDDPPDDPTWKALQPKLPPPGPRPTCTQDQSSFAAFRAFQHCRNGLFLPESELRQHWATLADGSVGAYKTPGWVSRAIGTGRPARDYSKITVPVLALSDAVDFDLSHLKPEHPQPRNDEERALVIAFGKATQAVFDRWSANLKRGVPGAKVVDMPGAGHYLWMTREADVLREIRSFVAGLSRPATGRVLVRPATIRAMTQPLSRRELLATAGAALALSTTAGQRSAGAATLTGGIKITMPVGDLTEEALAFVAYLGVEYVTTGGPASPTYTPEGRVVQARPNDPAPPWQDADLRRMKETVERAGLKVGNLMLHDFRRAILGRPGADDDIELVCESIRAAGRAGIPIVEYNWYALRAMGGYYEEPGRGGSRLAAHDYARSRDLPVLDDVGTHNATDLWTRYERFLRAVVPVAERANVRLAVHPNDPPPPRYRGTDQILGSVDGLKRVCETVKSPANGITLDVGVTREMGYDVIDTIRWFGGRDQINHVHFRNVLMTVPRDRYVETFIDAGDNDMLACLRALHATGYPRLLHPDHVPTLPGDAGRRGGWGYAIGQMTAMLRQL